MIYDILKGNTPIYIIEDLNNLIKDTITNICLEDEEFCIINLPYAPIDKLSKIINRRSKGYKKLLIICENASSEILDLGEFKEAIENIRSDHLDKKNKMIFLFRRMKINLESEDVKNMAIGNVIVSFKHWIKDFMEIVYKIPIFNQWEIYQCVSSYNYLLKKIFSGI